MVATRRGARTGPSEEIETQDPSMMLRKKPVRRATAKTTQAAPTAPAPANPRGRETRSKDHSATVDVTDGDVPTKEPQPATKRATRSKKAESIAPEQSEVSEVEQQAPRSQRGRKKATAVASAPLPNEDGEQTPKPSLASRPTRPTRAKAPASKPLSPKKITQVTKPQTRSAKSTDMGKQKQPAKAQATTTETRGRTTRKRTVSDENAEIPEQMEANNEKSGGIERANVPANSASPHKLSPAKQHAEESEGSMSSRGTTPSHSPGPAFEQPKDYSEDNIDAGVSGDDAEESDTPQASGSEDELCGPKTPMKRTSHHDGPKFYSSAQKNVKELDPEVPTNTPPRRYGAKSRSRATPKTQKPVTKAAAQKAPKTIARGNDHAFERRSRAENIHVPEMSTEAVVEEEVDAAVEDVEPAFVERMSSVNEPGVSPVANPAPDNEELDLSEAEDGKAIVTNEALPSEHTDPDETILISDDEDDTEISKDSSEFQQPTAQPEQDDEPLKFNDDELDASGSEDEDEDVEDSLFAFNPKTPRPETINWQNIRKDATIAVDFDFHLADARSPAKDGSTPGMTGFSIEQQSSAGAEQSEDDSMLPMLASDQPTMTLNDFIDVAALAEPTLKFDALTMNEDTADSNTGVEDHEDISLDLDDATVIVTTAAGVNSANTETPAEPSRDKIDVNVSSPQPQEEIDVLASSPRSCEPDSEVTEDQPLETQTAVQLEDDRAAPPLSSDAQECDNVSTQTSSVPVPHYAFPTLASRRKSLPTVSFQTPLKSGSRPNTSDGASIARLSRPFDQSFWIREDRDEAIDDTAASRNRPTTARQWSDRQSSNVAQITESPTSAAHAPSVVTPRERFPRLAARENYEDLSRTVDASARFHTPRPASAKRPVTAQRMASQRNRPLETPTAPSTPAATFQGRVLRSAQRGTAASHAQTVAAPARFRTPVPKTTQRPATIQKLPQAAEKAGSSPVRPSSWRQSPAKPSPAKATPQTASSALSSPTVVTPVPVAGARYPKLAPRQNYKEHASTVAAPARFRTPGQTAMKRPSTTQKPTGMRKVAFKPSTPRNTSHTPIKTPLKAPDMTPGNVPMTPHPAAPLRGVTALVEIFTLDGASASAPFTALLRRLGAKTTKTWSDRVTHVVFKDGSPTTLQRVRLHNKEVEAAGKGEPVYCVNSRWVSDCDSDGSRVGETDEAYAVDVTDVPRGGSRRRKSMEPNALVNLGGNIVRDRKSSFGRKNSIGRSSLGRSPLKFDSPEKKAEVLNTPVFGKENGEDVGDDDEFDTPEYLKSPGKLLQQTAPMNRVKKLDLKGNKAEEKNRRLTFWSGGN